MVEIKQTKRKSSKKPRENFLFFGSFGVSRKSSCFAILYKEKATALFIIDPLKRKRSFKKKTML
jgi:hypothetical protein